MIQSNKDYSDHTFKDLVLTGLQIRSSTFLGCIFERCFLVESIVENCRFIECLFKNCDCGLLQVPNSTFSGSRFEDTKLVGVNWSQANWPDHWIGEPLAFNQCFLNHSTFLGIQLKAATFRRCEAVNVDFRQSDLSRADFAFTNLRDSLFQGTDLSMADLRFARNYQIDPSQNKVHKARFSLPEAMSLLYSMDIDLDES